MRSNPLISHKASGIIDTDFERTGRNTTDTRHRHQPPANRIMLNDLAEHSSNLSLPSKIARRTSSNGASIVKAKVGSQRSSSLRTRASYAPRRLSPHALRKWRDADLARCLALRRSRDRSSRGCRRRGRGMSEAAFPEGFPEHSPVFNQKTPEFNKA
jgi:hypothetical protein